MASGFKPFLERRLWSGESRMEPDPWLESRLPDFWFWREQQLARLQRRSRWRRAHPTREERLLASWRQLVLRVQAFAILRVIALRLDLLLRRDSRRP